MLGGGVAGKTLSQLVPVKQTNDDALFVVDNGGSECNTISASNLTKQVLKERDNVEELIAGKVNRSGDTMTGILHLQSTDRSQLVQKASRIDITVTPGTNIYDAYIDKIDKNNRLFGRFYSFKDINGFEGVALQAFNSNGTNANLTIAVNETGTIIATAPIPPANANNIQIATTSWVRGNLTNTVKDFVIEYGGNNAGWYIKYNSGRIEQGGTITGNFTADATRTITLVKPFTTTNYYRTALVGAENIGATGNWGSGAPYLQNSTTTSFNIVNDGQQFGTYCCWYACGY